MESKFDISAGTLFEDFETLGDWAAGSEGAVSSDTVKFKTGTKSLKLVTDGGGASSSFQVTKTISSDLSNAGQMTLWVYVENDTDTSSASIRFSSTTDFSKYFTFNHASALHEGWNKIVIGRNMWTNVGGEDWSNTMIRLRMIVGGASTGVVGTVYFDSLYINYISRPKCVIIFDDFPLTGYTVAYPYMNKYRFKGTLAGVSSYPGLSNKMTLANIIEMHNDGWDVVNHTVNHTNLTTLSTQAEMEAEISGCKDWLIANGFTRSNEHLMFVYPQSGENQTAWAALDAQGMIISRGNCDRVQPNYVDEKHVLCGNANPSGTTADQIKAKIDRAISSGGTALIYFHILATPELSDTYLDPAIFYEVVDYLDSMRTRIDVITFSEWNYGLNNARKLV